MKKPVLTILMLLVLLPLMAQQRPVRIVNQEVWPVDKVKIPSCCRVAVVTDTVDCVRVEVYADSPAAMPRNLFYYVDGTLTVLDSAAPYGITVGSSSRQVSVEYLPVPSMADNGLLSPTLLPVPSKRSYNIDDRLFYKVMLACSNWGRGMFQGIQGIPVEFDEGAYSLAYRPSSVGVEINYAFAIHEHWSLGFGCGVDYNSYYFASPYVYYYPVEGQKGFRVRNVTNHGGWKSYVNQLTLVFPLQLNLFARPSHTGLFCQLELLPSLAAPASVGQSYTSTENGINTTTETSVRVLDIPLLSCHLRLSLNWGILGVYWENALTPMFRHMDSGDNQTIDLYPMRFGLSLDLSRIARN